MNPVLALRVQEWHPNLMTLYLNLWIDALHSEAPKDSSERYILEYPLTQFKVEDAERAVRLRNIRVLDFVQDSRYCTIYLETKDGPWEIVR